MDPDFMQQLQANARLRQKQSRDATFAVRVLKQVLGSVNQPVPPRADFDWFRETYPGFPFELAAAKLPYTHKATIVELFDKRKWKTLPWAREYDELVSRQGIDLDSQLFAMAFQLPHAGSASLMVIHNQPTASGTVIALPEYRDEPFPRMLYSLRNGVTLVVEPLASFLITVGNAWL